MVLGRCNDGGAAMVVVQKYENFVCVARREIEADVPSSGKVPRSQYL